MTLSGVKPMAGIYTVKLGDAVRNFAVSDVRSIYLYDWTKPIVSELRDMGLDGESIRDFREMIWDAGPLHEGRYGGGIMFSDPGLKDYYAICQLVEMTDEEFEELKNERAV